MAIWTKRFSTILSLATRYGMRATSGRWRLPSGWLRSGRCGLSMETSTGRTCAVVTRRCCAGGARMWRC